MTMLNGFFTLQSSLWLRSLSLFLRKTFRLLRIRKRSQFIIARWNLDLVWWFLGRKFVWRVSINYFISTAFVVIPQVFECEGGKEGVENNSRSLITWFWKGNYLCIKLLLLLIRFLSACKLCESFFSNVASLKPHWGGDSHNFISDFIKKRTFYEWTLC